MTYSFIIMHMFSNFICMPASALDTFIFHCCTFFGIMTYQYTRKNLNLSLVVFLELYSSTKSKVKTKFLGFNEII